MENKKELKKIKKIIPTKKKAEIKKAVSEKPKVVKDVKPKSTTSKPATPKSAPKPSPKPKLDKYLEAIGRRKTARARVRLWTRGESAFLVNDKDYKEYFPGNELQQIASSALKKMKCYDKFKISTKVSGGGMHAQAEAVRHGISRVLIIFNENFQKRLRKAGYLTRDPRMRERKKFGLKRARRAPQWRKR
jgi:small subunit ribosomal protein S9